MKLRRILFVGLLFGLLFGRLALGAAPEDFGCKAGAARRPYREKPDFAALEADPSTRIRESALRSVTPGDLGSRGFDQECIDRIYASLPSGPMPAAGIEFEGHAFLPDGGGFQAVLEQVLPATGVKAAVARALGAGMSKLPDTLIQGKVFSQVQGGDHPVWKARARLDTAAILVLDPSIALSPRKMLELRKPEAHLFFPARVYCGQSGLDSRRESIVIDPGYAEDFPEFKAGIDEIPGRKGMNLREEIRMIRPGFYLGRVYGAQVYLMSFTLYNAKVDQEHKDVPLSTPAVNECWLGTQARAK
jgi:hypothetical protein